jgi:acetyl esterase
MNIRISSASVRSTSLIASAIILLLGTANADERRARDSQVEAASLTAETPEVKAVLAKMAAAGVSRPSSVEDVRKAYLFYPKLSGPPENVLHIEDRQIPSPKSKLTLRIYTPSQSTGLPVFVFFHGGGFVAGSLDAYENPLRSVANRCECIVVSVGYRLAPEAKYPAAPQDAYLATKWVAEHANEIGGDPHRIAVGGDGAGGNLAAVVTLMARDSGAPRLLYQILIYPTLDFSRMRPSWWTETDAPTVSREAKAAISAGYLPIVVDLRDPYLAPIHAKDLKNLPSALFITYEGDNPMRSEGEDYVKRLTEDGVEVKFSVYPSAIHGFFLMAGELAAGKRCIEEVSTSLKNAFNATSPHAQ